MSEASGSNAKLWVRLVAGAGLLIAPWGYKFMNLSGAATSAWVAGAVLIALGIAGFRSQHYGLTWLQGATGIWLAFAPWVLKFANNALATQVHVIVGALMLGMAIRELLKQRAPRQNAMAS